MSSAQSQFFQLLIKMTRRKGQLRTKPVAEVRAYMEAIIMLWLMLRKKVNITPVVMESVEGEWIVPSKVASNRVLFYIHGGGYIAGSCKTHRAVAARFAKVLRAKVFHINYRLAPEAPFPAAIEDCYSVYKTLINNGVDPKNMIIGGESAGGALTLATLIKAREHNLPMPAAAFCLSPHTDFTLKSASLKTCEKSELFFTREDVEWVRDLYLNDHDPADPLCSPVYANLQGLPPLIIQAANTEMLRDDAIRLAARAKECSVEVNLKIWPGLFHAFQLIPFLPESKTSLKEIAAFVNSYLRY